MLCIQILFNYSNYHIRCQRTNISCLEFSLKSSIFHVSQQRHNSSADCARDLFKPSKDSGSLRVWNEKNFGFGFFMSDVINEVGLGHFDSCYLALGPTTRWSISLKFSQETRLESKTFGPLMNFIVFLVQKLWHKKTK